MSQGSLAPVSRRSLTQRAHRLVSVHLAAVAIVAIASLLPAIAVAASQVMSFDGTSAYPVGANPQGFDLADCDGDGVLDLVAAGQGSDDAIVHTNDDSGGFLFARRLAVVSQPTGASCLDYNRDGLVDLAVVSRDGTATIYRHEANDTFTVVGSRPAGLLPTGLISGDLTNDGIADLVTVGRLSQDITILFGTGTEALPPFSRIRVPIQRPRAVAIADFDLDGLKDIVVVGDTAPFVTVLFGDGAGFVPRPEGSPSLFANTFAPIASSGVGAGDLNDDGKPDLALLSASGAVSFYFGSGTGTFAFVAALGVPPEADEIALADLNGDGWTDIALGSSVTNSIQLIFATGPAEFPLPTTTVPQPDAFNAGGPFATRITLLDEDDPTSFRLQTLAASESPRAISLLDPGDLQQITSTPLATVVDIPVSLLLHDLTNDGTPDAIVTTKSKIDRGRLLVFRGTPTGGYEPPAAGVEAVCGNGILEGTELCDDGNQRPRDGCSKTCMPEIGRTIMSVAATDLDADGNGDLVVTDDGGRVWLLSGNGQGQFPQTRALAKCRRKTAAVLADFTSDGLLDVACINRSGAAITVLVNGGNGALTITAFPSSSRLTGPLLSGDFDRNGFSDLMVGCQGGWKVFYNDGAGPTRVGGLNRTPKGAATLSAADLNEDGRIDVLVTFGASKKIAPILFEGSSLTQFAEPRAMVALGGSLQHPFIIDVNQDRHQDLLTCNPTAPSSCLVWYGDGHGQFGAAASPPSGDQVGGDVRGGGAGDFDHDGIIDTVGVSWDDDRAVIVFRGATPAQNRRLELPTGNLPSALAVVDLNGDGFLDFVVGNEGTRDLSVFMNLGQGRFSAPAAVRLPAVKGSSGGLISLAVGDIDGDGKPDLAAVQAEGTATPLLNLGGGGLAAVGSFPTGRTPWGVALGELNGDGILDVVTANRGDNTFTVLLSGPAGTYSRIDYPSGGVAPSGVTVADLDHDGRGDVIVTNEQVVDHTTLGNVVTFLNNGAGGFGSPYQTHLRGRSTPRSICTGDFDQDGNADVAIASRRSSDVMVLHGEGNGSWRRDERDFPLGGGTISVWCLDVDADGRTDIAFGRRDAGDAGAILTGN